MTLPAVVIALASLGTWQHGRSPKGRPARVTDETPATANDLRLTRAQNSPAVASDPTDKDVVMLAYRLDAPEFGCGLAVSGDGGRGWIPRNPVQTLPDGVEKCYAPEIAFDKVGTLFYLFVGLSGPGNAPVGAFITTSVDRGQSFSSPRRVLGPGRYQVRLLIDRSKGHDGRLHMVWVEPHAPVGLGGYGSGANSIEAAHSDDGGRTFSEPQRVSDPGRARVLAPSVALGPHHALHVLYYDLVDDVRDFQGLEGPTWDGMWSLLVASSDDGGNHFGVSRVVDDGVVPPERVMLIFTMPAASLAVTASGHLLVAWYDGRNGDWDVFLRQSPNGGSSWTAALRLNDDALGNGRHQYLPCLEVHDKSEVFVIFYDRRDDHDNLRNGVYYTWSSDSGKTFRPNLRVTSGLSDSRSGQRYTIPSAEGLVEFGNRLSLTWDGDGSVLAAWADARNSRTPPQQDVFTARVQMASSTGYALGWVLSILAFGLLVVLGADGAGWRLHRRKGRSERVVEGKVQGCDSLE